MFATGLDFFMSASLDSGTNCNNYNFFNSGLRLMQLGGGRHGWAALAGNFTTLFFGSGETGFNPRGSRTSVCLQFCSEPTNFRSGRCAQYPAVRAPSTRNGPDGSG